MNDHTRQWEIVSELLDESGLTDLYDSFPSPGSPWNDLQNLKKRLPASLYAALVLMMAGKQTEISELPETIVKLMEQLEYLGFARLNRGQAYLNGLSLYRYRGCWLIAECSRSSPTLYYGDDSVELASRLSPITGARALDLCTGPGVIAMVEAAAGMHVTGVDVNPVALELLQANAYLNHVEDRVLPCKSNLFEALPDQQYELITANPPLLPIPHGVPYPFVGDGGVYGLDLTLPILQAASKYLTENGTLLIIGTTTMNGLEISQEESIRSNFEENGLEGTMSVMQSTSVQEGSLWNSLIAITSQEFASGCYHTREQALRAVTDGYHAMNVDGVCSFILRAKRGGCGMKMLNYGEPYSNSLTWKM
ncbi:MAG: methyltransferase [Bifidobacterium sp.]|jgi:release factor glutamine methyltransferase